MHNFKQALKAYKDSPDINHLFIMIQQAQWALNSAESYQPICDVIEEVYGQSVDWHECKKIKRYMLGLI